MAKIIVCRCKTCKAVKNKKKNRKYKKKIKRLLNKRMRNPQNEGKAIVFYWS